jgi:hypothetical protein
MDQLLQFWSDKEMAAAFIHAHFTVVDMNTQDFIYQTNTSSFTTTISKSLLRYIFRWRL